MKRRRAGGDKEAAAERKVCAAFNKHAEDAVIHHISNAPALLRGYYSSGGTGGTVSEAVLCAGPLWALRTGGTFRGGKIKHSQGLMSFLQLGRPDEKPQRAAFGPWATVSPCLFRPSTFGWSSVSLRSTSTAVLLHPFLLFCSDLSICFRSPEELPVGFRQPTFGSCRCRAPLFLLLRSLCRLPLTLSW